MKLERNARICRNCFFFWAIPYTIYIYYLSLYLFTVLINSVTSYLASR